VTKPTILVPDLIYTADTVVFDLDSWTEHPDITVSNAAFTLKWYARTNTASEGATITGKTDGTEGTYTGGRGQFTVKTATTYSGTPGAYDDRSRAEIDLGHVETAIRTLAEGGMVQEYTIGGRTLRRYKMAELLQLKAELENEINMERRKEKIRQGLGNPGLAKVRFV
jgi:hypothetical protein